MREAFVCQIMMESKRVGRLPAEDDGGHAKLTVFSSVGDLETEEMPLIHHEASGDSLPTEEHANSSCVFSIIIFSSHKMGLLVLLARSALQIRY